MASFEDSHTSGTRISEGAAALRRTCAHARRVLLWAEEHDAAARAALRLHALKHALAVVQHLRALPEGMSGCELPTILGNPFGTQSACLSAPAGMSERPSRDAMFPAARRASTHLCAW